MSLYASIETPETVHSPRSPSIAPSDGYGPSVTDITSSFRPIAPTVRPTEILSRASSELQPVLPSNRPPQPQPTSRNEVPSPSSQILSLATTQGQQNNADWSAALQSLLASPTQLQRLMQALAAQQNQPVPPLPTPAPADLPPERASTSLDPRLVTHQVTPYDPNAYDFSRLRTDIPPPAVAQNTSLLGPLMSKDDEGPSLQPLVDNADRLQKTYRDASEISADVDALQYSLNSLIHNLGLDPHAVVDTGPSDDQTLQPNGLHDTSGDSMSIDPTADFDFDAFLNEFANKTGSEPGFTDVTGQFDPSTPLQGTTLGDASTDQLTAFLDDVSSDTASLHDPLEFQPKSGMKRKSDVADLPPPLLSGDAGEAATQVPKVKRKR